MLQQCQVINHLFAILIIYIRCNNYKKNQLFLLGYYLKFIYDNYPDTWQRSKRKTPLKLDPLADHVRGVADHVR